MLKDKTITREWIDRTQEDIDIEIQMARLDIETQEIKQPKKHRFLESQKIRQLKKYRKRLEFMKRFGRLQKGDLYHSQ